MLVLVLIVVPLIVVAIVAARFGPVRAPWVAPAFGLIALASAALVAVMSFSSWNAADAVRIGVPLVGLVAWVGAIGFGVIAYVRGQRTAGLIALAAALAVVGALTAMAIVAY